MQEFKYPQHGMTEDFQLHDAGERSLEDAMADETTRAVMLHKPGSEVRRSNGRLYRVNKRGQWVRVREPSPAPDGEGRK